MTPGWFAPGLVLLASALLSACARSGPDRVGMVQGPLFVLVLLWPVLVRSLRGQGLRAMALAVGLQVLLYAAYESGVSSRTDIRVDLPLVGLSLLASVTMLLLKWRRK
jgi:hypothetical protein